MKIFKWLVALWVALALVACGGGGGSAGTPAGGSNAGTGGGGSTSKASISVEIYDQSNAVTTSLGAAGLATVKATLKDAKGAVVAGKKVSFVGDAKLIRISPASDVLTDSTGTATVQISSASITAAGAGTVSVTALIDGEAIVATKDYQITPLSLSLDNLDVGTTTALAAYGNRPVAVMAKINGVAATSTPVQVTFAVSCGTVLPAATATDSSGKASVTYTADAAACANSQVTITASAAGASPVQGTISVLPTQATNIQFASATPQIIYLQGSVGATQSDVVFKVVDVNGTALGNHSVSLSLVNPAAGGSAGLITTGVSLGTKGNTSVVTVTSDSAGLVKVPVYSGTVPTSVLVKAVSTVNAAVQAYSNVLTVARGVAVQSRLSLSLEKFSIEGLNLDGVKTDVIVRLADRVGNPVPAGTQVNFVSSAGVMIPPTCYVTDGVPGETSVCKSTLFSQNPRPAGGRAVVMAYVPGEEDFVDANGNNVYDLGEAFTDMGNALMDADQHEAYDTGEFSVPRAGSLACPTLPGSIKRPILLDGRPNTCDGVWGAADVRRQAQVVFASSAPVFASSTLTTRTVTINNNNFQEVTSVSVVVQDVNGNSMPTGTQVYAAPYTGSRLNLGISICEVVTDIPWSIQTLVDTVPNMVSPRTVTVALSDCYAAVGDRLIFTTKSPSGVVSSPLTVSLD
ncbi:Ig-like domain-containing protein [Malikia sp.]|uniref:Ig-like domain-containing protein n=1 Tax=Malikia sp. TaxID=2070706 RepID=UPI0026216323|nr:Ig-like domain-containing protein [Malikia sp.]MDD2729209.1 Ig-like domain-containing protein [Malikia sp.]